MKVALYYPWVYLKSGCERTIVELVRRSRHDWTILTNRYDAEQTFPELGSLNVVELPRVSVKRSFLQVFLAGWRVVGQKLPLEGQQALVVFSEGLGDLVVFRNRTIPVACLCFTPLRPAFDDVYRAEYLRRNGNGLWRRALLSAATSLFRVVDRRAWRRFHRVFAISEEARSRAVRGRLRPAGQIDVLHPGIEPSRLRPGDCYEQRFLIAGRIMWTKNIQLGIDAFQDLLRRRPDLSGFELVIAGFVDGKSAPYLASLREAAAQTPQVRFAVSPSDAEMQDLYRTCYAVVYTPFNEDWGLVPLEAMAMRKPVIGVDRGGPRETIVDGVTGYRLPPDAASFSRAMEALADDVALVRRMGARGAEHARRFNWDAFCRTLDDYLDSSLGGAGGGASRS